MRRCPKCNESYFKVISSSAYAIAIPTVVKDGKIIRSQKDSEIHECKCLACGEEFIIRGPLLGYDTEEGE